MTAMEDHIETWRPSLGTLNMFILRIGQFSWTLYDINNIVDYSVKKIKREIF